MEKYVSEHTEFIRQYLEQHPEEVEEQKRGRALWWDKAPRPLDQQKREAEAAVPPKAYYYDVN
jgi:hypothetical protein